VKMADETYISLSVPDLCGNEEKYVLECLRTNWISSVGRFVTKFEQEFALYVGAQHAVAVTSGTASLHLALLGCGVRAGDLVIAPSVTFIAPVNALRYVGADPLFLDIDPETLGLSAREVAEFLKHQCRRETDGFIHRDTGRRVRAVLPVHLYGHACEIDSLAELAKEGGLVLIEDAAEAVGCRYKGRHVGSFGQAGCFSFNGNKVLTTGGGGMLVTDDAELADQVRHLSTQAKKDPYYYIHDRIGYNYRMSNVQAAIGVAQLERVEAMIGQKRAIHARYARAFSRLRSAHLFTGRDSGFATYWMALLLMAPDRHEAFAQHMAAAGIQVRPIWSLNHELPMYRHCPRGDLSESERFGRSGVCLPCHQGMSDQDVERVVAATLAFF